MKYYGQVVDVKNNSQTISIGDVGISSLDEPILVTRDIQTCVAVLLITNDCAIMMHINLEDSEDYSKALNDLSSILKKYNNKFSKFQIFTGPFTKEESLEKFKSLLAVKCIDVEVYSSYLDFNHGSIAYDFSSQKYYGLDIEGCFRDYVLGADNERDYDSFGDKSVGDNNFDKNV